MHAKMTGTLNGKNRREISLGVVTGGNIGRKATLGLGILLFALLYQIALLVQPQYCRLLSELCSKRNKRLVGMRPRV